MAAHEFVSDGLEPAKKNAGWGKDETCFIWLLGVDHTNLVSL
jgi:hypothetical protein